MYDVFFRIRCSSEYESLHIFPKMWKYIYIYIICYWRFLISNNIAKISVIYGLFFVEILLSLQ